MAAIGLAQRWPMGLVPGRLELTTSNLIPRLSARPTAQTFVGTVSPSAVWYTSLGFVRSGNVALNTGAMRNFGIHGYGWSRIATVYGAGTWAAKAYNLLFNASGVSPSSNYVRWFGFPVRCLVY